MEINECNKDYMYAVIAGCERREFDNIERANEFYDKCYDGAILVVCVSSVVKFKLGFRSVE